MALLTRSAPVDPIEASLVAGEAVLAQQDDRTVLPPSFEEGTQAAGADPAPAVRGAQPVPRRAGMPRAAGTRPRPGPKLSGPAPGSVRVVAIGDSVMLGAAKSLKERLGSSSYIDANKNRQFRDSDELVKELRKQKRLAPNLIIHLGNNGPVKSQEIKDLLAAAKGVQKFMFVTVRVTKPWQDSVNAALKDADKNRKEVKIVNWYRFSEGHRDWFYSDGTHVNRAGADNYAALLHGSVPKATPKPKPKPKPKPSPTPDGLLPGIIDPGRGN
jgi:hypothetical protein